MSKYVIHFKLDGNGNFPNFLDKYPLTDLLPTVSSGYIKCGNKYLGVSTDDTNFWLPKTVSKLATVEDCIAFMNGAELVTSTSTEGEQTFFSRVISTEEKASIANYLFSLV
jgi:hypothetical protein